MKRNKPCLKRRKIMKLLHYKTDDGIKLAVQNENGIFELPYTLEQLFEMDAKQLEEVEKTAVNAVDENGLVYAPSVPKPGKILCIGLNYYAHGKEIKMNIPATPTVFSKFNNALAAHNDEIKLPKEAYKFDYEAELVIVIGKKGKDIPEKDALSHVFGYTVGNDFSARDLQLLTGQWLLGKSCDQFAPLGPCIVTAEGIDPQKLDIGCRVNGETVQSSNTENMIFDCAFLISYISKYITLEPGDVIFTGTPSGVILGKAEGEQNWLKQGDEVEVFVENIGSLKNKLA